MLTINQVVDIYRKGIEIILNNQPQKHTDMGRFDTDIMIYEKNINSPEQKDITLLHELIHARDGYLPKELTEAQMEEIDRKIDQEAVETYKKNPEILEFIKWLYEI